MILTITANPTIDRVLFVRDFAMQDSAMQDSAMQDVVRAEREVVSPSGKGLDVSLILHVLGAATHAISLNAGLAGQMLAALVAERGVPCTWVAALGETRVAALITDVAHGRQSTILAPTLCGDATHLAALLAALHDHAAQSWGLVCAGSLPPGLPADSWARLLTAGHDRGLVTLLDSSGPGLYHGVAGLPDILKINGREMAELAAQAGGTLPTADDLPAYAAGLRAYLGVWARDALVITLGAQGAVAVTAAAAWYAPALPVPLVSPAGAGDAVAAGLMLGRRRGDSWADALRLGVAAAGAVVMNEGTAVCTAAQVDELLPRVQVVELP